MAKKTQTVQWKPRTFRIRIDEPEEAENFLRALIIAKSNNSSPYIVDLIDAVNAIMEPYRKAVIENQQVNTTGRVSILDEDD